MSEMRMQQSLSQFEVAFEQEAALERRRREQLRQRASARSRARRIQRTETRGKVNFWVLLLALSFTVVVVTIVMFETLAWLMA
jgi:anti-sigma-K factor RskA